MAAVHRRCTQRREVRRAPRTRARRVPPASTSASPSCVGEAPFVHSPTPARSTLGLPTWQRAMRCAVCVDHAELVADARGLSAAVARRVSAPAERRAGARAVAVRKDAQRHAVGPRDALRPRRALAVARNLAEHDGRRTGVEVAACRVGAVAVIGGVRGVTPRRAARPSNHQRSAREPPRREPTPCRRFTSTPPCGAAYGRYSLVVGAAGDHAKPPGMTYCCVLGAANAVLKWA